MNENTEDTLDHCVPKKESFACSGCPGADKCRTVWSTPRRGPFSPAGLTLASMLVFILPLIAAVIGGLVAHVFIKSGTSIWEAVFAGGGLILGGFVAWLLIPLIKKKFSSHE